MATKTELFTLTTELLDGVEMNETLFDAFLDISQSIRENDRNWVILRASDITQSLTPANTYLTSHDLPSDFRKWYSQTPVVLVDSDGNVQAKLREIPIQARDDYKNDNVFYCDYAAKKIYLCGSYPQPLTIKQYYQKKSPLVSDGADEWLFPTEYHKILAFDAAVFFKLGVDYDVINNQQANSNAAVSNQLFNALKETDNELQLSSLGGQDYSNNFGGSPSFGRI
jgi:hypothetical protein